MKIFKQITNGLPRVISYIIFYSPLIIVVGLLAGIIPTLYYSFIIIGLLVVLLLDLSLIDMLISHHYMSKSTERILGNVDIDAFAPYKALGIPYKIKVPCANYTDSNNQDHSLWINSKNINTKNLKQDQKIELIYSSGQPIIAQLAVDWDITQKKHMAENIAQLVLLTIFTIGSNWGFLFLIDRFGELAAQF